MLFLLLLFRNCCMVQFILLKPLKYNFLQFLEEAWTGQCVECKVHRELLLYSDQLMPPPEIGENWIWEVWGERNGPCRRRQKYKRRKGVVVEKELQQFWNAAAGVTAVRAVSVQCDTMSFFDNKHSI